MHTVLNVMSSMIIIILTVIFWCRLGGRTPLFGLMTNSSPLLPWAGTLSVKLIGTSEVLVNETCRTDGNPTV